MATTHSTSSQPAFSIRVPSRNALLVCTIAFSILMTLLLWGIANRVLSMSAPGQSLGFTATLLIAATTLVCGCAAAVLAFQRLQLPLEAAHAFSEEQTFRVEELEADAASLTASRSAEVSYQSAAEAAKLEAAALTEQLRQAQAELARVSKQIDARPRPVATGSGSGESVDALTGFASGNLRFERRLNELAEASRRSGTFHGLLLVAIDHLGRVHDQFGPAAGEENIWQIAQQIRERMPPDGEVFRLSAKHFAMLLPEKSDSQSLDIAQRLCTDVSGREYAWEGQPLPSSLSIGVVSIGLADHSETEIMERAVHALTQAQQLGGSRVHKESLLPMLERRAREKSLSDWLKEKLKSRQLRLAAQPIVLAVANAAEPSWHELLLRIEDDDGVWLTPEHYVDVLERMQLTSLIDKWVLETALKDGMRIDNLKLSKGRLSINIFGSSLLRDSFLVQLRDVLSRSALPTQQIVFELDEAFVVQHSSRVAAFVHATAEFGCQLALDRYRGGVGLSALRHFPAQYIKLHESLVQRQTTDLIDRAHIDWLVTSAHLAGAKVVASAVRDEETLKRLRSSGVDYVQGFAIAAPSPYSL